MIEFIQKNDYSFEIEYTRNGQPVDATGYLLTMVIKEELDKSEDDSNALMKKEFIIQSAPNGIITVDLDSDDTNIVPGRYVAECQISRFNQSTNKYVFITLDKTQVTVNEKIIKDI